VWNGRRATGDQVRGPALAPRARPPKLPLAATDAAHHPTPAGTSRLPNLNHYAGTALSMVHATVGLPAAGLLSGGRDFQDRMDRLSTGTMAANG
jgi:hypothetical protein